MKRFNFLKKLANTPPCGFRGASRVLGLVLVLLTLGVGNAWGADPVVNSVIFEENFGNWGANQTDFSKCTALSNYTKIGTVCWVSSDKSGVSFSTDGNAKGTTSSGGNCTSGHIWVVKNSTGYFTISGIPLYTSNGVKKVKVTWSQGGGSSMTCTYAFDGGSTWNNAGSTSSAGATVPASPTEITVTGHSTIALKFTRTSTNTNLRIDNIKITVTEVAASSFTVTYDGNGNTGGTVPTDATAYSSGATVTVKGNTGSLVKTNYAFGGWNTNDAGTGTDRAVGSTFSITANTTLYAKWIPTYTVTYNGNGNTSGSVPTDATKYQTGTTVTVKDNTGSLAKSGWTFAGWNKNNTGTGTNYAAGSGTFSISANTTLYAKWTRTVTWSVNGATNVYSASTVTYNPSGSKVSSLPTAPNPASYCGDKFVGWTTDAEYVHGTSPLFTTAAGSPDLNSITTDVIFYAVFADYDE